MTPQRAKELLPIITAFANGEQIQIRNCSTDPWITVNYHWAVDWSKIIEARIKPKPREFWLDINEGFIFTAHKDVLKHIDNSKGSVRMEHIIHVREVMDE